MALMGRNGMGKTTTIRSIMGLTPRERDSSASPGQDIRGLPLSGSHKLGIGLVPEGRQFSESHRPREPGCRVRQSPRQPIHGPSIRFTRVSRLAERGDNMGATLSGGEQQMLAIGRALMINPRLLILDEATEGLAPLIRDEIWNCLSLLKAQGQSVLVIDKNVEISPASPTATTSSSAAARCGAERRRS